MNGGQEESLLPPAKTLKADPQSCALLLAIARQALQSDPPALRDAAEEVEHWDDFLRLAQAHRMAPMAFWSLQGAETPVPATIRKCLADEYERNLCQSLLSATELLETLALFAQEQIPAMPFKGVALAAAAWRPPELRASGDLDLLIRREDLERASAILEERGFRRALSPEKERHERVFLRQRDGAVVELRWVLDFVFGRYGRKPGFAWAWQGRCSARLNGVEIPAMSPEKTLILLGMHASKHVWSRLMWVCDVAQVIASAPDLDWLAADFEARSLGLWKPFALGILLAHRMTGFPVGCPLLSPIQRDRALQILADHFEKNLLITPGVGPAGHVPYNMRLLDFRDRMRWMFSGQILLPNERDRAAIPFSGPQLLYYFVRPVRVLLDRSAR